MRSGHSLYSDVVRWKDQWMFASLDSYRMKMGKDHEWLEAVKTEDIQTLNRLLSKCKVSKNKLLGPHKRLTNIQDEDGTSGLHQAALTGSVAILQLLLENGAQVDIKDNKGRRALHHASQLGHTECVELLLRHNSSVNECSDNGDTPLHLATQQGHDNVVSALLASGASYYVRNNENKTAFDIACEFGKYRVVELFLRTKDCCHLAEISSTNSDREKKRWLHLAFENGHLDIVRLLVASGVDIESNTTLQQVWTDSECFPKGEMRLFQRDVPAAIPARAIRDYADPSDPDNLQIKQGDFIMILEQNKDGRWKGGLLSSEGRISRQGYFPYHVVQILDKSVGGSQRTGTLKTATIKKVAPPTVPGITNRSIYTSNYDSQTVGDINYGKTSTDIVQDAQNPSTVSSVDSQMEDQGIEIEASPGRESPGGSSVGCLSRHSTASVDSGRSSIPCSEIKNPQRLSVQSCDSNQTPNSSFVNVDDCVNVAEMLVHNLPDIEILKSWLSSVHFEEYTPLFLQAGYDMPTVSRMTPEDLTAVGITKPVHRRNLKAEIAKLNISDGIPEFKPDTLLEWLQLLRLEEYHDTLCQQGYDSIDKVADLAWEDLEEIGIQKLGHQKKIMLAIKRVRDINSGVRKPYLNTVPQLIGRSTLPRPQTLGSLQPTPSFTYHSQEVAITTVKVKSSPSTEVNVPEFKTFQQSPTTKTESFRWSGNDELTSQTYAVNHYEPQMVAIQVQSPNRGHSLENLDANESVSTAVPPHNPYLNSSDTWYDTVSAWRQHGYDTDSELNIHSSSNTYAYETDGTATLHRPKGLVKPRPVAKIVAKSRHVNPVSDMESVKSTLKSVDQKIEQASTEEPQQTNGPASIYGTLKYKKTPPPPPKRSNSIKGESSIDRNIEAMKDEAFATCVKGLASHFNMSTKTNSDVPPPSPAPNQNRTYSYALEEFPPPPSPLPSAAAATESDVKKLACNESEQTEVPELFSNAMFRQRRKHSIDSNVTLPSTESNTLPFANENVSTIKQKTNKAPPQMSMSESKSPVPSPSVLRKTNLTIQGNKMISAKRRNSAGGDRSEETPFARKVASATEDVIDDIEHMLTNLSNQLDAMLEDEKLMKDD